MIAKIAHLLNFRLLFVLCIHMYIVVATVARATVAYDSTFAQRIILFGYASGPQMITFYARGNIF